MDYNDNMYEEVNFSGLYMGEQDNSLDLNMDKTKNEQRKRIEVTQNIQKKILW